MSTIELSGLPIATSADNSDTTLIRKGFTDYQVAVGVIRNIDIFALDPLPNGSAVSTDKMMISRIIGGNPQNFNIAFSQVGLMQGTKAWFWQAAAPLGWSIIANTGDRVLGVSDGTNQYAGGSGGSQQGTWVQDSHVLTVEEMPAHTHVGQMRTSSGDSPDYFASGPSGSSTKQSTLYPTGGAGSTVISTRTPPNFPKEYPAALGHNHGSTWRPLANVGILCNKDG